jgi:hypothetical protein
MGAGGYAAHAAWINASNTKRGGVTELDVAVYLLAFAGLRGRGLLCWILLFFLLFQLGDGDWVADCICRILCCRASGTVHLNLRVPPVPSPAEFHDQPPARAPAALHLRPQFQACPRTISSVRFLSAGFLLQL